MRFNYKTCFKFAAPCELENLQLKICSTNRCSVIALLKQLLRANLFHIFASHDVMAAIFGFFSTLQQLLLRCETDVQIIFSR